ncbi:MAG: NAD(P)/FAD-dependent oxidoreductase [Chloroflexota bacterium]|jgi:flavin-dependent dehydrogenase
MQVGRRIPSGLTPGPLHRDNVVLIGDAAGVADPFFGEGISYAALSGRIAAQAVADYLAGQSLTLSPYTHRIKSVLKASTRFWRSVAVVVHRFPALSLRTLAASRRLQTIAERAIAGDVAFLQPLC